MSRRKRTTRRGVRVAEKAAALLITVGGIGTIVAVSLIFVFLVVVVLPLFRGAEVRADGQVPVEVPARPVHFLMDEYRLLAAALDADGTARVYSMTDGELVETVRPFEAAGLENPTAWSVSPDGQSLAFALPDGRIGLGRFGFETVFPRAAEVPADLRAIGVEERVRFGSGVLQRTSEGALRFQRFLLRLEDPFDVDDPSRVALLAHTFQEGAATFCAWTADRRLLYLTFQERLNFLTGESEVKLVTTELGYVPEQERGPPARLLLTGLGDNVLLVWSAGRLERLDIRNPARTALAEVVDLTDEEGDEVTALAFLIGNSTLIVGSSAGRIDAWFRTKPEDAVTPDGTTLVRAHRLYVGDRNATPVTALAPSPRGRLVAAGFRDGALRVFQVTTEATIAVARTGVNELFALRIAPKEDGIVALGPTTVASLSFDAHHPEATVASLFTRVWYEGYPAPEHVWQSESATDDFEPKFGFLPLVFGTLKATFYSMIFGAPLALLAAIFTSEFLDRRLRTPIKSSIEMMASLPSVVLGFLAGAVIAPFAQKIVPATMAVFVTVPLALLLGAYLWQLLPQRRAIRWSGWQRVLVISAALPLGIIAALRVGPWMERVFFAGDLELWLDGQIGSATGGWALLLLPLAGLLVAVAGHRLAGGWFRALTSQWSRTKSAGADLLRFGTGVLLTVVLALGMSYGLDLAGFDPRGSVFDTYVQRNALIVGFVMGFAIIPIIYTLAEDALSSVPEHLRLASLGAGATPWQTAIRIIVPTAMSGLFSALMIGLGRAVGETMIVLMATGNTPVMEMNIFNGFRTLSANIAVELPEAVKDSTHYRTLFLAALVLFGMTFLLNTVAESVRQRFRKRSYQL